MTCQAPHPTAPSLTCSKVNPGHLDEHYTVIHAMPYSMRHVHWPNPRTQKGPRIHGPY